MNSYIKSISDYLLGGDWNMTGLFSHSVGNGIIIPIDELIFFRGVGMPPTRDGTLGFR